MQLCRVIDIASIEMRVCKSHGMHILSKNFFLIYAKLRLYRGTSSDSKYTREPCYYRILAKSVGFASSSVTRSGLIQLLNIACIYVYLSASLAFIVLTLLSAASDNFIQKVEISFYFFLIATLFYFLHQSIITIGVLLYPNIAPLIYLLLLCSLPTILSCNFAETPTIFIALNMNICVFL